MFAAHRFPTPRHTLVAALLLSAVSTTSAGEDVQGGASLLLGADRLFDPTPAALGLSPALCARHGGPRIWAGLNLSLALRNDMLSLNTYNDHVGHFLDESEKRRLLNEVGGHLGLDLQGRSVPFALSQPLPALGEGFSDPRLIVSTELESLGRSQLDAFFMELVFFGNDPLNPVEIESADFHHQASWTTRLAFAAGIPDLSGGRLPGAKWRCGASLGFERGMYYTETLFFSGRIDPPNGSLEGEFEHVQRSAPRGAGFFIDLGLGLDLRLLDRPFSADLALTGLFHSMKWRDGERVTRRYRIPATPISSEFDYDVFDEQLLDTTITSALGEFRLSYSPGLLLGLRGRSSEDWHHALLLQLLQEGAMPERQRRFSLYNRWSPRRAFHLGLELAAGFGRGPSFGVATGTLLRLPKLGRVDPGTLQIGLGAKSYAGLFNGSRGLYFGGNLGLLF